MDDAAPNRFPIPAATAPNPAVTSLEIRRSKFVCLSCRCASGKEARAFVGLMREKYPDATHHCFGYVAGPPGSSLDIGYSDDGEPHGTAGMPILRVLLSSGIGQVCSVVARWFGGVKLGAGGLARAYRQCALENVAALETIENVPRLRLEIKAPYSLYDGVSRLVSSLGIVAEGQDFAEQAVLTLGVPKDRADLFLDRLGCLGNGQILSREIK